MIGKIISHYHILEELGRGGMGVVYKAYDSRLDRIVALKFLPSHMMKNEKIKARFLLEAKAAAAINQQNVCVVHDIQKYKNQQFIVMEFLEGETLRARLVQMKRLSEQEAVEIAIKVCNALKKVHAKGIIHRDIKPDNIMISPDGDVKVMDFGLAILKDRSPVLPEIEEQHRIHLNDASNKTSLSTLLGTACYMSPEQIKKKTIDERSDIFSFGVVLYEMLIGSPPFTGIDRIATLQSILRDEPKPPSLLRKGLSNELELVILKALEKRPYKRFSKIDEILIELQNFLEKSRGTEKPTEYVNKTIKGKRFSTLISVALLVLLMIIGYFIIEPFKKKQPPWLQTGVSPIRLTTGAGGEIGRISPDGHFLVYQDDQNVINLKVLETGEITTLTDSLQGQSVQPVWSPDGEKIAFLSWRDPEAELVICDKQGEITYRFTTRTDALFPTWTPDGSRVAWISASTDTLVIINLNNGEEETISLTKGTGGYPAWSPDSRYFAFLHIKNRSNRGSIHIVDIETGTVSDSLSGVTAFTRRWWQGGLAWSPDGKYLVYPGFGKTDFEFGKSYIQLFALPMMGPKASGEPIAITHFNDVTYIPAWPCFTKQGKCLSFCVHEENLNIYASSFKLDSALIGGVVQTVADDKKMDMDPCWTKDGKGVIFCSNRDGPLELYHYYFGTKKIRRLTFSGGNKKRNPQISPDGKFISYFSDGVIKKIPFDGGDPQILTSQDVPVHFEYAWANDGKSIYVSITDSLDKQFQNIVQLNLISQKYKPILRRSLLRGIFLSPDGRNLLVSTSELSPNKSDVFENIGVLNLITGEWRDLARHLIFSPIGRISWTSDGRFIILDRKDISQNRNIYELIPVDGGPIIPIRLDAGTLRGTILLDKIDPLGNQVLIKVLPDEADIYRLGS